MSFAALKASRQDAMSKLISAADSTKEKSYGNDGFWTPTVDKAGNGYAVIRFLPAPQGEDLPWSRYWDHGFKGPTGRWYIENSLTSIGQKDPVSDMNSYLWNTGREEDKDIESWKQLIEFNRKDDAMQTGIHRLMIKNILHRPLSVFSSTNSEILVEAAQFPLSDSDRNRLVDFIN